MPLSQKRSGHRSKIGFSRAFAGGTVMFRMFHAALLCASIALGQESKPKLTFEVASIKPAAPQTMARMQGSITGGPGTSDPGRIQITDMPVRVLIMRAYDVQS